MSTHVRSSIYCFSFSFFAMKMVTSCLCLAFLLFSHSAHAQWSQSLGWGSAGNGKRSLVEPAAGFSDSDWCNSISNLQKLINALQRVSTVEPTKSDSDVIFCLQLLSKTFTCTHFLS